MRDTDDGRELYFVFSLSRLSPECFVLGFVRVLSSVAFLAEALSGRFPIFVPVLSWVCTLMLRWTPIKLTCPMALWCYVWKRVLNWAQMNELKMHEIYKVLSISLEQIWWSCFVSVLLIYHLCEYIYVWLLWRWNKYIRAERGKGNPPFVKDPGLKPETKTNEKEKKLFTLNKMK